MNEFKSAVLLSFLCVGTTTGFSSEQPPIKDLSKSFMKEESMQVVGEPAEVAVSGAAASGLEQMS